MLAKYLTCKTRLRHYKEGEEVIVARLDGCVPDSTVITETDPKSMFHRDRHFLVGEIAERLYKYECLGYLPEELGDLIHQRDKRLDGYRTQLAIYDYVTHDINSTIDLSDALSKTIKDVIFNDPATIVFWMDGTKTVVKAQNEDFDPEKGLAMAIAKKFFGNKGNYCNEIKKWTEKYDDEIKQKIVDGFQAASDAVKRLAESLKNNPIKFKKKDN